MGLRTPIALDDGGQIVLGETPIAAKRRLLKDAETKIGIADRARHIKLVAAFRTEPQHGMALGNQAERRDGDAQRAGDARRVAANESDPDPALERA